MFFVDCTFVDCLNISSKGIEFGWKLEAEVEGNLPTLLPLHEAEPHFAYVPAKDILERCPGWSSVAHQGLGDFMRDHWDPGSIAQPCQWTAVWPLGKALHYVQKEGLWYQIYRSLWFTYHFSEALSSLNGLKMVYEHAWGSSNSGKGRKQKGKRKERAELRGKRTLTVRNQKALFS